MFLRDSKGKIKAEVDPIISMRLIEAVDGRVYPDGYGGQKVIFTADFRMKVKHPGTNSVAICLYIMEGDQLTETDR